MQLPLQISFVGMEPSEFVAAELRAHAACLERFHPHLTSCRVVLSAPHHHQHKGRLYSVRIDLTVPGAEIAVNREHSLDRTHEDLRVAIRDAFDAARRRLEDCARVQRAQVKQHAPPTRGKVIRILPAEGYGFIRGANGTEVYFHRNSVLNDAFDRMRVGAAVRFVLEQADKGPNATSVRIVGRRRHPVGSRE